MVVFRPILTRAKDLRGGDLCLPALKQKGKWTTYFANHLPKVWKLLAVKYVWSSALNNIKGGLLEGS